MTSALRATLLVLLACLLLTSSAVAQDGQNSADDATGPTVQDVDDLPAARLERAREAFRQADYGKLVPLLAPVVPDGLDALNDTERADARELYAVGLFFKAQQAQTVPERDALLDDARAVFLDLLRQNPDFQLDALLYPASVVELFEEVVEDNADELAELRAKMNVENGGPTEIETVYIQREATRNRFPLIFLPFAVGQFQNGDLVKGTLLASVQATALALNFTSFLVIESLRNQEDGRYDVESGNYASALAWRNVLYGSLITFGIAYAISVVDAWTFFEEYKVNIRTLDGPPPELTDVPGSESSELPLGFSLEIAW